MTVSERIPFSQLLECVVVDSKERITVIFKGGIEAVQPLPE